MKPTFSIGDRVRVYQNFAWDPREHLEEEDVVVVDFLREKGPVIFEGKVYAIETFPPTIIDWGKCVHVLTDFGEHRLVRDYQCENLTKGRI